MTQSEFEVLVGLIHARDTSERQVKGQDYARPDEDIFANFREAGAFAGVTPMQAWGVYLFKQVSAVMRFVRDGKVSSEGIESRLKDVRNYSLLGQVLSEDPLAHKKVKMVWDDQDAPGVEMPELPGGLNYQDAIALYKEYQRHSETPATQGTELPVTLGKKLGKLLGLDRAA